jgi:tetratricopeptide (TPR) repeat protein
MWEVQPNEDYVPIYCEGLVLQSYETTEHQGLEQLLNQAREQLAAGLSMAHAIDLANHIRQQFSLDLNQAACLLGEIRAWKKRKTPLPALEMRYHVQLRAPDAQAIIRDVAAGLGRIAPRASYRPSWTIGTQADVRRSPPSRPWLRASTTYRWGSPSLHLDGLTQGWLDLECIANWAGDDHIGLTFHFRDELGFLFHEARRTADEAVAIDLHHHPRSPGQSFAPGPPEYQAPGRYRVSHARSGGPSAPERSILSRVLTREERLTWMVAASYVRRAEQLVESGHASTALPYADMAVKLADASCFRSARGFVRLALGDTKQANDDFKAALSIQAEFHDARNASAFRGHAAAYYREGKLQEALAWCNSSMQWGMADGRLYEIRGCICHDLRNFHQAIDDYNQARDLLGSDYPARLDTFILQAENEQPRAPKYPP